MSAPIWMQSREGRVIDLIDPSAADVDFREIAHVLAGINRYAGNSPVPVSDAFHTLLAAEAAPAWIRPWVLLHDAHEVRIGDITTPVVHALDAMIPEYPGVVSRAILYLKAEHDKVIWSAAGLSPPTPSMATQIRYCDLAALNTERRDFLAPSPKRWDDAVESVPPLPRVFRGAEFGRSPFDIGERLYAEFRKWLPVFAAPLSTLEARTA